MKNISKKKFIAAASMILTLVLAGVSISYAWFMVTADDSGGSEMGKVEVEISDSTRVERGSGEVDCRLGFTITNNSNVDVYMRMGWMPVYRDSQGNDMTYDTSEVSVLPIIFDTVPPINGINAYSSEITSRNGYNKKTAIFEDSNGKYIVISAGVRQIEGRFNVYNVQDYPDAELHLILVPEAIQATWKAVDAAAEYGWTTDKVGSQASTIVSPTTGGGN